MFGQKGVLKKGHLRQPWKSGNTVVVAIVALVFLAGFLLLSPHLSLGRGSPVQCVNVEDTLRSELGGRLGRIVNPTISLNGGNKLDENLVSRELDRPKLLGVVGIQTGFDSEERRKSLRETWMPSTTEGIARLEESTGLAIRFVIGHTKDAWKTAALDREISQYRDFLRIDIEENYHRLKYKTLAYFKAAFLLFDADFYVKADDDIYLRPDRLSTLLAADRTKARTYLGCMKKGPVITDSRMKWYEPMGYMLGSDYFLHAYGPIYALSREVVADLAAARNDSFRYFSNEDVTVGVWMLAMNVNHEDNRALCDPTCHDNSIAVWDIPKCSGLCNSPERMRELHKLDMCSKSPTVPN